MERTDNAEEADVLLLNTCSIREKAQEKVFHQLGRWKAIKAERPEVVIGVVAVLLARRARPSATAHPMLTSSSARKHSIDCPRCSRHVASGTAQLLISRFPRLRSSIAYHNRPVTARQPSSPSWKAAASTAPFAWFPTLAVRRCRGRSMTSLPSCALSKRGRQRGQPAWPERERLPRREPFGRYCRFRRAIGIGQFGTGIERIRYTTSHPVEFSDALIECYRDIPALVDHLHLRVQWFLTEF